MPPFFEVFLWAEDVDSLGTGLPGAEKSGDEEWPAECKAF